MAKLEVVWVDDDSPKTQRDYGDLRVTTVQTVAEAEKIFEHMKDGPNWVIMDLIVPQGGWGNNYTMVPGIDYIKEIKQRYGEKVGIGVFTAFGSDERRAAAEKAGATFFYEKTRNGFLDVLDELKRKERLNVAEKDI